MACNARRTGGGILATLPGLRLMHGSVSEVGESPIAARLPLRLQIRHGFSAPYASLQNPATRPPRSRQFTGCPGMSAGFFVHHSPEQIKASLYKKHNCLLSDWPANWFMQLCIGRFAITSSNSLFFLRKAYPIARATIRIAGDVSLQKRSRYRRLFRGLTDQCKRCRRQSVAGIAAPASRAGRQSPNPPTSLRNTPA